MNRTVAQLAEQSLELAFSVQNLATPNPFRPVNGRAQWWQTADPQDFYAIPKTPPKITFHTDWKGPWRTRARFSYPSLDQSPYPENNTVYGLASLASLQKPRASLIVVHGHRMTSFAMLEWFAIPAARMGLDIYYVTLPYHMQRAPKGTWSGQLVLNSDVEGTALAFRQGVRDVRLLISYLQEERGVPVGLAGMSLGAYTCCMASVVDDRPGALVSILGGASLAQLIWDGYEMGRPKSQMLAGGVTRSRLEQYWDLLGPGNWQTSLEKERILMLAGEYDPIVTPENVKKLWKAWDKPEIHWYPCGHGTIASYYREVVREMTRFFNKNLLQTL